MPLAADLLAGNEDVRPRAGALLRRALAGLPKQVCARARVRADAGYFCAELAHAAVDAEADFAIAAKRNPALWRAYAAVPDSAWLPARDMPGAQVSAVDYAPQGWPPGTYTIIRRVRVDTEEISGDARSRRRRTIPKDQLQLALDGSVDHVWAVSFIVTNIPADDGPNIVGIEAWFRCRTDIEDRIREAKLGAGLRHLPSADRGVNTVWMWGALLAGVLSVMIQSLTGLDTERGRARAARFRHELLRVPARVIRHARALTRTAAIALIDLRPLRRPPGRSRRDPGASDALEDALLLPIGIAWAQAASVQSVRLILRNLVIRDGGLPRTVVLMVETSHGVSGRPRTSEEVEQDGVWAM